MDRGARWATVHGVAKSDMTEHVGTYEVLPPFLISEILPFEINISLSP